MHHYPMSAKNPISTERSSSWPGGHCARGSSCVAHACQQSWHHGLFVDEESKTLHERLLGETYNLHDYLVDVGVHVNVHAL
jgi:hypothetical protein